MFFRRMRRGAAVVFVLVLAVVGVWLLRSPKRCAERDAVTRPTASTPTQQVTAASAPADVGTDDARQVFAQRINTFVAAVKPFGIDEPIAPESILAMRTNTRPHSVVVKTSKHLVDFQGNKLVLFAATVDGTDTRRDPSAANTWYQATAPWTKEQAIAETQRLMQALGISFPVDKIEYEAVLMTVKTPSGERVKVTPFHDVSVYRTNGSLGVKAEFRMGDSGPGRLTRWFDNSP